MEFLMEIPKTKIKYNFSVLQSINAKDEDSMGGRNMIFSATTYDKCYLFHFVRIDVVVNFVLSCLLFYFQYYN